MDKVTQFSNRLSETGLNIGAGNLAYYLSWLFRNVDIQGSTVLDVGSGSGLFSYFAAWMGAAAVVSLEPEAAGSTSNVIRDYPRVISSLGLNNIELLAIPIQEYDPHGDQFDIVLLHDSINHLEESACIQLRRSRGARIKYERIFDRLQVMTRSGGTLIIVDCSPYNLFSSVRLKNPFSPTIEWHKHQPPGVWVKMLRSHGFIRPSVHWIGFGRLGRIGEVFMDNPVMAFLTTSRFRLEMKRA